MTKKPNPNFKVKLSIYDNSLTKEEFIEELDKFLNDIEMSYWETQ